MFLIFLSIFSVGGAGSRSAIASGEMFDPVRPFGSVSWFNKATAPKPKMPPVIVDTMAPDMSRTTEKVEVIAPKNFSLL